MNKTAIKNFAISARTKLIAMVIDKAGMHENCCRYPYSVHVDAV